ncbi:MAG: outer membrane lipoprotein carrier protein LolA [Burkholderiales bacterium]|nr:MAG: outer membrane lipoprotein carrier protein LolA [Burkholderiales bacterium]
MTRRRALAPRTASPIRRRALALGIVAAVLAPPLARIGVAVLAPPLAGIAVAQQGTALAQLRQFVATAQAARGRFVQLTQRAEGRPPQRSEGVFSFSRPGRFRWEIRVPYEQLLVADGERLFFYDRDLEQVTIRSVGEAIGASPAAILFGAADMEESFELSEVGEREALQWLAATPRARDAGVERIEIGFADGQPRAMRVRDSFGGVAELHFEALEINPVLAPETFRFVPPPGADVIRQ